MARLGFVGIMSFVVLGLMLGLERSEGVTYTVGDSTGWGIPTNADFYDNWTDGKTFTVGDVLVFNWNGVHDVATVTEQQHDTCTSGTNVISTSPATITLDTTGNHYYICTISNHCSRGQRLDIDVVAASTTTPPTPPSTTNTSTTPPTTTTTPSASSPPPPAGSSASFGPIVALSALLSLMVFSFLS